MESKSVLLLRRYNFRLSIAFEPRDMWVGVYWNRPFVHPMFHGAGLEVYICIIPMFPIKIEKYWFTGEAKYMIQWWQHDEKIKSDKAGN